MEEQRLKLEEQKIQVDAISSDHRLKLVEHRIKVDATNADNNRSLLVILAERIGGNTNTKSSQSNSNINPYFKACLLI